MASPTVTLLYAAQSTGTYTTLNGSATFTLAVGDILVIMINGISTSDQGPPVFTSGPIAGMRNPIYKLVASYNAFVSSANGYGGFYILECAVAGSYTINGTVIGGGSDGIIGIAKITGMPPGALSVVDVKKLSQLTTSTTFSLTTTGEPKTIKAGDLAIGARWHENNVGSTSTITPPSGFTSLFQYLNGTVNLPTDFGYKILTANGNFTATWTSSDAAITDTEGCLLILRPQPLPNPDFSNFPV